LSRLTDEATVLSDHTAPQECQDGPACDDHPLIGGIVYPVVEHVLRNGDSALGIK
jgi:hypothetical protein